MPADLSLFSIYCHVSSWFSWISRDITAGYIVFDVEQLRESTQRIRDVGYASEFDVPSV
jgi:hypothetical protein